MSELQELMNKNYRGYFDYENQCNIRWLDPDNIIENLERFLRERGVDPTAAKERDHRQLFKIKDLKKNLWKKAGFKKPVDWFTAANVLERRKWTGSFFEISFKFFGITFWRKPKYEKKEFEDPTTDISGAGNSCSDFGEINRIISQGDESLKRNELKQRLRRIISSKSSKRQFRRDSSSVKRLN